MIDERRLQPRMKIGGNAYLTVEPDNAGVVTDVSETGLAFNLVFPVQVKQRASFGFQLPGMTARTLVDGKVVWTDSGGKSGGAALIFSEDFRQQVTEWSRTSSGPQLDLPAKEASDKQLTMAGDNNRQPITTSSPDCFSPWQVLETGNNDVANLRSALASQIGLEKKEATGLLAAIKWLRSNRRTAALTISVLTFFAAVSGMVYLNRSPGFKIPPSVKSVLSSLQSLTQPVQSEIVSEPTASGRSPKRRRPERVSGGLRSTSRPIYLSVSTIPADAFEVSGNLETRIIFGGNTRTIEFLPSATAASVASQATAVATVAQTYSGLIPEVHEPPIYPDQLLKRGIQGGATVEAAIDPAGSVNSVTIIAGDPLLATVVSDAVKQWRYRPFERERTGQAPATTRVFVRFTILPN